MKKQIFTILPIIILFIIWAWLDYPKPPNFGIRVFEGKDYEVKVLIDTVLIFDPETGKEEVKIRETRDTVWLNKRENKK